MEWNEGGPQPKRLAQKLHVHTCLFLLTVFRTIQTFFSFFFFKAAVCCKRWAFLYRAVGLFHFFFLACGVCDEIELLCFVSFHFPFDGIYWPE